MKGEFVQTIKIDPAGKYLLIITDREREISEDNLNRLSESLDEFVRGDSQFFAIQITSSATLVVEKVSDAD